MLDELPLDVLRSKVAILWDKYGQYIGEATRRTGKQARDARLNAEDIKRDIDRYEEAIKRREAVEESDGYHSL